MKSISCLIGLIVLCVAAVEVRAGGPPPVCMVVDKLVFEPNEKAPTRVQIWGTFALLNDSRTSYGEPVHRYLYFAVIPGKEAECRQEWAKLKELVAEHHVVAYGMCGEPKVADHLRKTTAKLETPARFSLVEPGFSNADQMCANYPSLKELLKLSQQQSGARATRSDRKTGPDGK